MKYDNQQQMHMNDILPTLDALARERHDAIEAWFAEQYRHRDVPIYSSIDIRHAGFKMAPVDTNLFPAGFNNLTESGEARAADAFTRYIASIPTPVTRVLLMTESHSRNLPYLDNIQRIRHMCHRAGLEVALGRFDLEPEATTSLETSDGIALQAEGIALDGGVLHTASGFVPDIILVNNDLSSGCPEMLCNARQPVFPPPGMGWYRRRKSIHFAAYNRLASDFARQFELDEWLISTVIHHCGRINFKERKGLECVAIGVDKTLHAMRRKYQQYGIAHAPYVFIKADSGTYGMGVMTAHSGEDVYEINKKTRNKMNVIKEGMANTEVIIQEGIPTADTRDNHPAEPVAYLVGGSVVDCFWRVNAERSTENSLNASGMTFTPFDHEQFHAASGLALIARLATLAAAHELYEEEPVSAEEADDEARIKNHHAS